jgi:carbonic anhydrase
MVTDRRAVAVDVASLRAVPALPGEWLVSGLVYDVATGLVNRLGSRVDVKVRVRPAGGPAHEATA